MYRQHNFIAFSITTLVYILAAVLFWYMQQQLMISDKVAKEKHVKLDLSYFVPQTLPPVSQETNINPKPEVPEEKPQQQEAKQETEPPPVPEIKKVIEKPKPLAKPKPTIKPKPVIKAKKRVPKHSKKRIKKRTRKKVHKKVQKKHTKPVSKRTQPAYKEASLS